MRACNIRDKSCRFAERKKIAASNYLYLINVWETTVCTCGKTLCAGDIDGA